MAKKLSLHPLSHMQFSYFFLGKRKIFNVLLKYGYKSFTLDILEYCELNIFIKQYYLDLLKPEYNILKIAGSSLGRKLSEDSKI